MRALELVEAAEQRIDDDPDPHPSDTVASVIFAGCSLRDLVTERPTERSDTELLAAAAASLADVLGDYHGVDDADTRRLLREAAQLIRAAIVAREEPPHPHTGGDA